MCSILVNRVNKDLTNIIREYLLPIKEYNKIVKTTIYHKKTSNIESLFYHFEMKKKYQQELIVYKSNIYLNTIHIICNYDSSYYMKVYDFPYRDISKIVNENVRNLLYNRKNWNNDHIR